MADLSDRPFFVLLTQNISTDQPLPRKKAPLLAGGMMVVPFSANTGFNAPREPSR